MVNCRCIVVSSLIALFSFGCLQKGGHSRELVQPVALEGNISQLLIEAQNPQKVQSLLQQADNLLDNHYHYEAVNVYNQLLALQADNTEAWNNRGNALAALKRYQEAIASYDQAIAIKANKHQAWYNRGNVLAQVQRYQEAISSYDQAIRIKSDKYEAWINRGVALSKLQHYQEAIDSYNKAIAIEVDASEAYYNKACVYALQNNIGPALKNLRKVIEQAPERYQQLARNDSDFDKVREDKRFQNLIQ